MTVLDHRLSEAPLAASPPALATRRLILRAPRLDDTNDLAALINDRRIAENTTRLPHPYTLADAESFVGSANQTRDEAAFLITSRDGTLLGGCGIARLNCKTPEIGYWLGVPYWGHGYTTEAARALIDHAFADLGYEVLQSGARVSNPASRRVLEKCGFQWTGVALKRIRAIASAAPFDQFRLDRGLWTSLKSWGAAARVA
jgi:RimJ/RimL family protein N-acetyltransferase